MLRSGSAHCRSAYLVGGRWCGRRVSGSVTAAASAAASAAGAIFVVVIADSKATADCCRRGGSRGENIAVGTGGNAAEWLRRQEVHVSLRGGEVACLIPKL